MNTQKVLTIGLAVNSLLIVGLLIAVVRISSNQYGDDLEKTATAASGSQNNSGNSNLANKKSKPTPAIAKTVEISITDDGFVPLGFSARTGETIALAIKNESQKEQFLKIDDLEFDSDIIAPGESKTVQMPAFGNEPKIYEFYSGDGKTGNFNGTIMVLEK